MKIIIVGCGKIGKAILSSLVAEGHDIVAVDRDPDILSQITDISDVMGLCGNGVDVRILEEAGAKDADLLIAATDSDETNMLLAFMADRMGTAHTIARIRNPEYNEETLPFAKNNFHISMALNPDKFAAQELFRLLRFPSAMKIETFSKGNLELVELVLKADSHLDGLSLSSLREKYSGRFLICAVQRGDEVFIPGGDFVLRAGDHVGLTADPGEISRFFRQLGLFQKKARDVMILGGSRSAWYLAESLNRADIGVTVVDKNPETCAFFSENLPKARVINADGTHQELLQELGIASVDAFVALTGMDEVNILMSIYAQTQKVPKVICKINRTEMIVLAGKLSIESVISPRKHISNAVLRYVRALENSRGSNVETLYRLMDDRVEALEFNVKEDPRITGIPLRNLKLKKNLLIAGIVRERKSLIPSGSDTILPGDSVVVLTTDSGLRDLSDILA